MQQCTESGVISWKSHREREKESDKMHAYTQTSNERCIKIKGTRKFNWCQCTTTSLSLLTKCSTRTSRSVFPDGFSFFTFLFPTLCHNRNESALQMLKIEVKKKWIGAHTKKRFQWHVFDYCFEYTFYFKLFGHWMPSAFSPPRYVFRWKWAYFYLKYSK